MINSNQSITFKLYHRLSDLQCIEVRKLIVDSNKIELFDFKNIDINANAKQELSVHLNNLTAAIPQDACASNTNPAKEVPALWTGQKLLVDFKEIKKFIQEC